MEFTLQRNVLMNTVMVGKKCNDSDVFGILHAMFVVLGQRSWLILRLRLEALRNLRHGIKVLGHMSLQGSRVKSTCIL